MACSTFTSFIAKTAKGRVASDIQNASFLAVTSDGSTDSSCTEQELVCVRFAHRGTIHSEFAGIVSPACPDAAGIFDAIMKALETVSVTEETLQGKLVGFGCDGASVMVGKTSGVAKRMTDLQPSLITVHCLAHRLELAFKDAVKGQKLYDSTIVLLLGTYYFYQNSPKQRECLRNAYDSLGMKTLMPTRVGGTRWVGHLLLAVETFLKGLPGIQRQMEDCVSQEKKVTNTNGILYVLTIQW